MRDFPIIPDRLNRECSHSVKRNKNALLDPLVFATCILVQSIVVREAFFIYTHQFIQVYCSGVSYELRT